MIRRVRKEELKKKGIRLPSGYYLEEEEDFAFLCFRGETIATFNSRSVNPREIEAEAKKHSKKQ